MQYLVARYDKEHKLSYPEGSREAIEVTNWLFFMNAGVGPMQGQANHFTRMSQWLSIDSRTELLVAES